MAGARGALLARRGIVPRRARIVAIAARGSGRTARASRGRARRARGRRTHVLRCGIERLARSGRRRLILAGERWRWRRCIARRLRDQLFEVAGVVINALQHVRGGFRLGDGLEALLHARRRADLARAADKAPRDATGDGARSLIDQRLGQGPGLVLLELVDRLDHRIVDRGVVHVAVGRHVLDHRIHGLAG